MTTSISIGLVTSDRIKQTSKNIGIDPAHAANRHLAERLVDSWKLGMGSAPVVVKGGLLYPQHLRPTQDADLVAVRRYSNTEVQRGIGIIANHLERHEGISICRLSPEPKEIDVGYGDPVTRYEVQARIGGPRGMLATSRLDISYGRGQHALPKGIVQRTFPSFMKAGRSFTCLAQPLAAAAADHWLAVLGQRPDDMRLKHQADLLLIASMDIDAHAVAGEIERICRYRGLPVDIAAEPDALVWTEFERREEAWDRLRAERRGLPELTNAFLDIHNLWGDVHAALRENVAVRKRRQVEAPSLDSILRVSRPRVLAFTPR